MTMMPLDYVDYFKLQTAPFGQVSGSEFFFAADQHERMLDELYHIANNVAGLAVLTGSVGTGKTTLLRQLQRLLPDDKYHVITWVMHQPCLEGIDLLRAVSQRLAIRVTVPEPDAVLWNLHRYAQTLHHQRRRLVLLMDEAQMLRGTSAMEALRALLNLECDGTKMVTVVLAGLDPLVQNLAASESLAARVTCRGELTPFELQESLAYVQHRLTRAGAKERFFDESVLQRVHDLAGGVPRVINALCDNMLVRLARMGRTSASTDLAEEVARRLHVRATPGTSGPAQSRPAARLPHLQARVAERTRAPSGGPTALPIPSLHSDLLSQANDIAARLALGGDELAGRGTPPAGTVLPPEATVEMPGNTWAGVQAVGDFLGNGTPPEGLDPRGRPHTDDDVVMSILGEAQRRFE